MHKRRSPRPQRIAANLAIMMFLYCNLNVFLSACLRIPTYPDRIAGSLPSTPWMATVFNNFTVFETYTKLNNGFSAWGLLDRRATVPASPTSEMIDLHIYEEFPVWVGEANARISLNGISLSRRPYYHAKMATKLREIHNKKRPDRPVQQVAIYYQLWPESRQGYFYRMPESQYLLIGHD